MLSEGSMHLIFSAPMLVNIGVTLPKQGQIVLNSNGFNPQKPSSIKVNGRNEQADIRLTLICFQSTTTYEYRPFVIFPSLRKSAPLSKF